MKAPLGLAAAVVAAAALPLLGSDYAVGIGLSLAMWVALTQSWVLISGMAGYVSLGHVVFYGTGAYVMVLAWQQYPRGWRCWRAASPPGCWRWPSAGRCCACAGRPS